MSDLDLAVARSGDRVSAGEWVSVWNAVVPERPYDVEDHLHHRAQQPDATDVVALERGRAVGCGHVSRRRPDQPSTTVSIWLGVLEEERRRGVGSALFEDLRERARTLGDTLETWASEGRPDALRFLQQRGFAEVSREQDVVLDLRGVEPGPVEAPPGIRLTTLAAEPELAGSAFELARLVLPEIPSAEPHRVITRERWEHWLRAPRVRHDAILLAVAGDRVVAYAALSTHPQHPDEANHDVTAVHPELRRRGVARALKATQIAWARQHGIQRLRAQNDLTNEPIRGLNDQLGYRALPARITLRAHI